MSQAALEVDPDALTRLGRSLADVAATLRGAVTAPGFGAATGDPCLDSALADVEDDWSHARRTICDFLEAAGRAVTGAATAYADLERAICGTGPK
jgi:hypothetical protein